MTSNKFYKVISWISVIFSIGFFLILSKELIYGDLSISEIAVTPIVLGIILLVDLVISFSVLKHKSKPHIIIVIFQISIIVFCLYLIYYYNSGMSVKVDRSVVP
jgi:hypothetical protein